MNCVVVSMKGLSRCEVMAGWVLKPLIAFVDV